MAKSSYIVTLNYCILCSIMHFVFSYYMDVKTHSSTIAAITNEMQQLIETQKTYTVPANAHRTSDKPKIDETRQDEMPEVQTRGAVLPP